MGATEPEKFELFDWTKGEPESLEQAVQIAVGAASACWENLEGAGVFDDRRATEVSEQLLAWLRGVITSHQIDEALLPQYRKAIEANRNNIIRLEDKVYRLTQENGSYRRTLVALDTGWTPPPHVPPQIAEAVAAVVTEFLRAKAKHGEKCIDGPYTETQRLAVLVEEVGEVAHELTYDAAAEGIEGGDTGRLLPEVIQAAAMAVGWVSVLLPGPALPAELPAAPTVDVTVARHIGVGSGRVREAYGAGTTVRVPVGAAAVMVPADRVREVLELLDPRS